MSLKPEKIKDLSPDKLSSILERSAVDVSGVYDHVRRIVEDVRLRGDAALLEANRELKRDISSADLEVSPEEVEEAYGKVDRKVVDALEKAASNILKFHEAQREREMWFIDVAEGILAGRMVRPMERVGCYVPGGRAATQALCS